MTVSGEKISSGFLSDYEPLGVNGDPVYRAATQIRTLLTKDLGENIANLFATPLRDDRNNAIDWYSAEKGQVTPFNTLSTGEQASFTQEIKEKLARVEDLGRRLSSNPQNQTARTYAGLLKSIQNYPDASQIFIVNNHPVIAFWGFHTRQQLDIPKAAALAAAVAPSIPTQEVASVTEAANGSLINSANLISPPTSDFSNFNSPTLGNSAAATQHRSFWSRYGWWLLILLLLLIGTPTFLKGCSTDFPLFGAPHQHSSQGPNSEGPAVAVPEPSLTHQHSSQGPNSEGPAVAVPEPSLTIEALKQKDVSIFNGNWNLITSLVNKNTNELIKLNFDFDKNGQGTATIKEKNGRVCNGSANAKINSDNTFSLAYSELSCNNSGSYVSGSATCKVSYDSTKADCLLTCAQEKCKATFQRE